MYDCFLMFNFVILIFFCLFSVIYYLILLPYLVCVCVCSYCVHCAFVCVFLSLALHIHTPQRKWSVLTSNLFHSQMKTGKLKQY